MSFLMRQVAHCDVCGHEWLTKKVPSHCAKCKSRKWNQPAQQVMPDKAALLKGLHAAQLRNPEAPERTVEYEE